MRFLSHLLVSVATFVLTATLFIWTIDARVLNADVLSGELRKAGVGQELTKLMPEIVTGDEKEVDATELADMKSKIGSAVSADYVESKIGDISYSVLTFMREGEPDPTLDLSDFPERIKAAGIEADGDFSENFAEPIKLNENGDLDPIHDAYNIFNMVKYAGIALFAVLMLIEWFVAERGKKLMRISRVFLYAGVSYLLYWVILILIPIVFGDNLRSSVQAKYDTSALIDSVMKAIQGLFSIYFLSFAIGCLFITTVLYLIRHYKHGDVLRDPQTNSRTPKK